MHNLPGSTATRLWRVPAVLPRGSVTPVRSFTSSRGWRQEEALRSTAVQEDSAQAGTKDVVPEQSTVDEVVASKPQRKNRKAEKKDTPDGEVSWKRTKSPKESSTSPARKFTLKRQLYKSNPDEFFTPDPQPKQPDWQAQKAALKEKFPEGWNPRKRLSPDALAGIRALNAQFPDTYTTQALADKFQVSVESIRRILKSKWMPSAEEEQDRQERWFRRGVQVWERQAAVGVKPPRKWRREGVVRDAGWHEWKKGRIRREKEWEEGEKEVERERRRRNSGSGAGSGSDVGSA